MKDNQKSLSLLADRVLFAEETQDQNDVFLTIDMIVCSSAINGNNEGVSREFMADIVSRNDEFVGLPLYVDIERLTAKEYDKLTHLYNRFSGKFETTQIGGLTNFRIVTEDGIDYLQATARIPKRESEICECLTEMYEDGLLCFSFEVKYNPADTHMEGGAKIIDLGPHNALSGVAVVSKPAYVESVALDLVAELNEGGEPTAERGETMPNENVTEQIVAEATEAMEAKAVEVAEETVAEQGPDEVTAEEATVAEEKEAEEATVAEEHEAEEATAADETGADAVAEVVMHQVEVEQTYHKGNPEWNEPDTICTETKETVIETVDEQTAVAEEDEKDRRIAELENRIAELEVIEGKYNAMIQAEADRVLAEKKNKAKLFAEKQGLDVNDERVANAIAELNYEVIADLSMEKTETVIAEQEEEEKEPEVPGYLQMASYVDMNIKDEDGYGGMLQPVSK